MRLHVPAPDDPWMLFETSLLTSFTRIFPPAENLKFFSPPTVACGKSDNLNKQQEETIQDKKGDDDDGDGDDEDENSDEDQNEKKVAGDNATIKPNVKKSATYEDIIVMVCFYINKYITHKKNLI